VSGAGPSRGSRPSGPGSASGTGSASATSGTGPRRVVATGLGMVTALGADVASTWDGLLAGRSGIRTITAFDPSRIASRIAGEVPDFDPSPVMDRKEQRRNDRFTQLALVATREALADAGLPERLEGSLAERTGIVLGTGMGGGATFADQAAISVTKGPDRISPFFVPMVIPNLAAGQAAIFFGALGPNFAVSSACATGGHCLGEAWEMIRRGDADVMIAGSSEAGIHEMLVGGFAAMRALSTRNDDPAAASRPFDRGRDGFVAGEGAGVVILEALEHARARGAEPLAELVGYGATADAHHITLPAPGGTGAIRAVRRALEKAGLTVDDVEHVNAHATSTPEGDRTELEMLRGLFGARAGEVSVTANKSMLGHTLGAAGSIEAAVTILSLRHGLIPPTINLDDPDELAAGLDLTPGVARRRPIRVAVSSSFGFGGQNSALVFRRWEG
jgi:3-oxoacyl-[acyl-carrier-protein] synthase II